MQWNFSFGWMIIGLLITAISGLVISKYQIISDNMLSGVSSYDRVKFWGLIGVGLGLAVTANLHTLFLSLLVSIVFKR
ncbi:hypothetical protein HG461_002720 [Candidatus Saccharibacteria bacterium]|jgi:hypothetical protein cdiviTM7_02192|nr:hypothetical protein [Candidatus Saccharibacteria bacterium]MBB1549932.1 hypothetical protein [Candidatus Saccharibacteria bacterium]MBF1037738.1 hypothetical protein [Candidatus Nanosynbacter sp.]